MFWRVFELGSRKDGFKCEYLKSRCCDAEIRFETHNGYSIQVWCSECGNYMFTGRIEGLISLWVGDKKAILRNKGFVPEWSKEALPLIENEIYELQKRATLGSKIE